MSAVTNLEGAAIQPSESSQQPQLRIVSATLASRVADSIYNLIMSGKFKPGARLNEQALSEMFGVSRTPVREALKVLAAEAIIEILPRRGAIVHVAIPEGDVRYVMKAHAALWRIMIEALAERATPQDIEALQSTMAEMRAAIPSEDAFYILLDRYNVQMGEIAAIPVVHSLLRRVQRLGRFVRRTEIGPQEDMQIYVDTAEKILDAIEQRDLVLLRSLTEERTEHVMRLVEAAYTHHDQ